MSVDPLIKITESPTQAAIRWSKRAMEAEAEGLDTQRNEERADAEIGELTMKLHTLEAAVRAVRDEGYRESEDDIMEVLEKLYALVPDGSEGGS